jgi:hypothetical protein
MARMAGREAELEILGHQGDEAHYLDDEVQIAWMLDDAEPWGDPQSFKTRLRAKTRMLVRRHRKSIKWGRPCTPKSGHAGGGRRRGIDRSSSGATPGARVVGFGFACAGAYSS